MDMLTALPGIIGFILISAAFQYWKLCRFQELAVYFLLIKDDRYNWERIFKKRELPIIKYIVRNDLTKPLTRLYLKKTIRALLAEIEGFQKDSEIFGKLMQYQRSSEQRDLRDKKIREFEEELNRQTF